MMRRAGRWWPKTIFARLTLIFFFSLIAAHVLSYSLVIRERANATTDMMLDYLEKDSASSVALLDRLPKAERAAWLPRVARRTYSFSLEPGLPGRTPDTELSRRIAAAFVEAIGTHYPVVANQVPGSPNRVQAHVVLSDGTPLTIDMHPARLPIPAWLPMVLALQLLTIAAITWLAVRVVTRPLVQLAVAADGLGPDFQAPRLDEAGPSEVARAARAFNAMQARLAHYMAERMQILAAISHDLQTPITRMRMRADMLDEPSLRQKLNQDLQEMESLVREGVSYARTLHGASEPPTRIDPDALLSSVVYDYQDAGRDVGLDGQFGKPLMMRPQALRRVLGNLIDNALKFGEEVKVQVVWEQNAPVVYVRDNGPGIPDDQLEQVFQPFYRVEGSRNRETGGTGLGLAIARQLSLAMQAELTLRNRPEGGLEARLRLGESQVLSE